MSDVSYSFLTVDDVIKRVMETFSIRPNDGKLGRVDENQTFFEFG